MCKHLKNLQNHVRQQKLDPSNLSWKNIPRVASRAGLHNPSKPTPRITLAMHPRTMQLCGACLHARRACKCVWRWCGHRSSVWSPWCAPSPRKITGSAERRPCAHALAAHHGTCAARIANTTPSLSTSRVQPPRATPSALPRSE